jgi:hypothetical protein
MTGGFGAARRRDIVTLYGRMAPVRRKAPIAIDLIGQRLARKAEQNRRHTRFVLDQSI